MKLGKHVCYRKRLVGHGYQSMLFPTQVSNRPQTWKNTSMRNPEVLESSQSDVDLENQRVNSIESVCVVAAHMGSRRASIELLEHRALDPAAPRN